jgi:hypothetical protein
MIEVTQALALQLYSLLEPTFWKSQACDAKARSPPATAAALRQQELEFGDRAPVARSVRLARLQTQALGRGHRVERRALAADGSLGLAQRLIAESCRHRPPTVAARADGWRAPEPACMV